MEQEQNEKQEIAQSATVELTTADGKKKKSKTANITFLPERYATSRFLPRLT